MRRRSSPGWRIVPPSSELEYRPQLSCFPRRDRRSLKIDSEIGQDIPARCGEVAPLVRVGGEVEELVRGLCMVDELPSAFSDHIGAAPGSMPVILAKRHPVVVVGVDILKRDAAPAARPMRCCGAEERRLQVELGDGVFTRSPHRTRDRRL